MMKYLKNSIINIITFIKAIFEVRIYWKHAICKIEDCIIDKNSKLNKPYKLRNVTIGYGTYIATNPHVSETRIGKFCSIGPNLICGWGIHPLNGISTSPIFYSTKKQVGFTFSKTDKCEERKPIVIGNDVFIGANVTILDGVTIGDGAIIGAGAIVSKDIPSYAVAIGCPVQIVKYRFDEETIQKLLQAKWWDKDIDTFKKVEENFFKVHDFININ